MVLVTGRIVPESGKFPENLICKCGSSGQQQSQHDDDEYFSLHSVPPVLQG